MPKVSEEHREARRQQILVAALRCAARAGLHKTTMNAVIRESGLSAGAVYLYFRNKQDLVRTLAATIMGHLATALAAATEQEPLPTPEEAVARAAHALLDLGEELGVDLPPLVIQAWAEAARDPEMRIPIASEAARIRTAWEAYARRAITAGHLHPDADPEAVGRTLMSSLPGFMLSRTVLGGITPETYVAGLADLRR